MSKSLTSKVAEATDLRTGEIRSLQQQLKKSEERRRLAEENLKHAEQQLAEANLRQEYLDLLNREPNVRSVSYKKTKPTGHASAIVVWNDWHVEELVDSKTVNGLNEYNLQLAEKRFLKSLEKTILLLESARTISKIDHLVLGLLGDHITGYIHEELVESNLLSPTDALLLCHDLIATGIKFLLKEAKVARIDIVTCYGNHGRTTMKPRVSTASQNSFEQLLYKLLSRYMTDPRLNWQLGVGYHNLLEIQGKLVRFHHGDAIKYGGGVGGLTIPTLKSIAQWDRAQRADLDIFGHYHQFLFHKKFVCCNCMIGYNAYALKIKADHSDPSQTFIVMDKSRPSPVTVQEIYCT